MAETNFFFGLAGAAGAELPVAMKWRRAFTVVEVMILLLIIAFLLAMMIPAFQKIQQAKAERNAPAANTNAPPHP